MNLSRKFCAAAVLAGVSALTVFFASCGNSGGAGYTESPNGLKYKIITSANGAKAKEGEYVKYYSTIRTDKDSVLFSLSKLKTPQYGMVAKPNGKGDPIEILTMMGKGDSASCLIPAELFFKNVDLPANLKKGDNIKLEVKILDILNQDQYQQAMGEAMANRIDENEMSIKNYISQNGLTATRTASGMYYTVETPGTGAQPVAGKKVKVNYTGRLLDGTIFDSSLNPGRQPFEFTIGRGEVIKGWDEGIPMYKVGGKGKLLIPASLGYGEMGQGNIPANAVLIFDIEVLGVE